MKKVSTGGSRQTMKNDPNKGSVYTIYFIVYTTHTRPCFGDVIGKSHCLQNFIELRVLKTIHNALNGDQN